MKSIRDFDLKGKRVIMRCDFNVPLDASGAITDDYRIRQALPTLQYAREQGAKTILISHLGKPHGKVVESLRLDPVREALETLLQAPIQKADEVIGKNVRQSIENLKEREFLLLENIRFYEGETTNDPLFVQQLASLGDVFINNGLSVSHRNHASVTGLASVLPTGAGLLLEKEVTLLSRMVEHPEKPFVAIVGGSKVETKLQFINKISGIADWVLLGNLLTKEAEVQEIQFEHPEKIIPSADGVMKNGKALDIGEHTRTLFTEKIQGAKTVFWAGPLGFTEEKEYVEGSIIVANAIIESNAYAAAGGGDLGAFLGRYGFRDKFDYVATGGSATLAFIAGENLPGLKALKQ